MLDTAFVEVANRMADAAGEILRKAYRQPLTIDHKADASPVTQVDREVESALRALIEKHFPGHGIIGEEFGNVRESSPYQWVLDPIDGTHAFIAGTPTFTTLIALAYEGVPVLGVIDQPITKERWVGVAGEKTVYRKSPHPNLLPEGEGALIPSPPGRGQGEGKTLAQATLATTAMKYFTADEAAIFTKLQTQCANVIFGGDGYLYAKLASGEIDLVIEAGLKPYDFCALKPVVEGAGGVISDWNGKPVTIASGGSIIAAANKQLHAEALALLCQ